MKKDPKAVERCPHFRDFDNPAVDTNFMSVHCFDECMKIVPWRFWGCMLSKKERE